MKKRMAPNPETLASIGRIQQEVDDHAGDPRRLRAYAARALEATLILLRSPAASPQSQAGALRRTALIAALVAAALKREGQD